MACCCRRFVTHTAKELESGVAHHSWTKDRGFGNLQLIVTSVIPIGPRGEGVISNALIFRVIVAVEVTYRERVFGVDRVVDSRLKVPVPAGAQDGLIDRRGI